MLEKVPAGVGRALSGVRAGATKLALYDDAFAAAPASIEVSSPDFADGQRLPVRHTADGTGSSPALSWRLPGDAASLVLIVEDSDSPSVEPFVHAIAWKLDAGSDRLAEGALSGEPAVEMGRNSYFRTGWLPCDPPTGHGPHRYAFQLFALDTPLHFDSPPGRAALLEEMKGHVLARGALIGTYDRSARASKGRAPLIAASAVGVAAGLLSVAFWRLRKRDRS